ncbi:hypothetical protein FOCC_FOCC013869 [Frankliniella occidentalis]|nr:hypothetical protein FOCC_FOCC013869 [Frankliniella occidentalis]
MLPLSGEETFDLDRKFLGGLRSRGLSSVVKSSSMLSKTKLDCVELSRTEDTESDSFKYFFQPSPALHSSSLPTTIRLKVTDDNDKLLTPVSGPDFWSTTTAAPQDAFRLPPIPARKRPPVRYQDPFRATTAAPRKRRPWEFQRRQESVGSMPNNAKTPVWLPRNPDLHNPTFPPPDMETTPFSENPDNFPDLPDDFSFLAREPQQGQPLPQDFPDFPPSSHPLDTPLASSGQYASPYGIMVPKEFLDTDLTQLSLPTTPARSKRGVMHSVFGVMDSDDRSQLQDKYNEMKTKIDGLTVLQAAQTGLANVTLARFLTHDRMITALKEAIREHYTRVQMDRSGRAAEIPCSALRQGPLELSRESGNAHLRSSRPGA